MIARRQQAEGDLNERGSGHRGDAEREFAGKLSRLSGLSGRAFDATYLREMATLHDAEGASFAKKATAGGSGAYRAFGAETHRIVQRHIGAIHAVPAAD